MFGTLGLGLGSVLGLLLGLIMLRTATDFKENYSIDCEI